MSVTVKQTTVGVGGAAPAPPGSQSTQGATPSPLPNLTDWVTAQEKIKRLVELSCENEDAAATRRDLRNVEVDVDTDRRNNKLAPDAVYTPVRIINTNIEREQGKYVAYLKQPQRAAFFYCLDNPSLSTELMAMDFTKRWRYTGWDLPMFANVDRFQTHGWSVMEVQYDVSKPGRFYNDDVPFEDFLVPVDFREVQTCEMLGRKFHKTKTQLYKMVETHKFDSEQVAMVVGENPESDVDKTLYTVEKMLFRVNGQVQVAWSCADKCNAWLRVPRAFNIGVVTPEGQPIFELLYPYVLFPYKISENKRVTELKGRVFYDEYSQETATSLMSSAATGLRRSTYLLFSKDDDSPNSGEEVKNMAVTDLAIVQQKIKQLQLTPPDSQIFPAIQSIITQNSQESGNINYAASNRVDSRKTAREVESAAQENALLATTQTALFSSALSQLIEMNWRIFASQVVAGLIKTNIPVAYYQMQYAIQPAGDIEVVARQEKLANMKQTWPVVQQTPIATEFLKRMLMLMYPEDAPVYNSMLMEDQAKTTLLTSIWQLVLAFAVDPHTGQLEPQAQPFLQDLFQVGEMMTQVTGEPNPFAQLMEQAQQPSNFDASHKQPSQTIAENANSPEPV